MLDRARGTRSPTRRDARGARGRGPTLLACAAFAAACGGDGTSGVPTFAEDVAPILHERCAGCHRPEGPAPIDLLTYEDAVAAADATASAVESGRMPPWLPAPGDVAFEGDRSLGPDERRTLVEWARSGRPPGDLRTVRPPRFPGGWQLGEPDRIARTEIPYPVPASGGDRFRNLVIRAPVAERVWVRGLELRFDDPSVVHHAMITFDRTRSSRRMDARDPEPGFDGMFASTEALGPSGFLLGWTPGREPALSPMGLAFPLDAGTDIVLQLHLRPTGEAVDLEAEVGIHTADAPPERTPFTIRLGLQEIDIPPGDSAWVGTDAYTLPVAVEVLGIYPHAHYLGKEITLTAARPDSGRLALLDIPRWDFNWQDAYRLAEPVRFAAGTRLEGRFVYDNTAENPLNPHRPPRRVLYGPRSEDEMGEIWIQVVPVEGEDLEPLTTDFARKDMTAKMAGWRHTLATRGDEPVAHVGLGTVAQAQGRLEEAIAHFRAALAEEPDYAVARYNLALALESRGDVAGAAREYERTVREDPGHAAAHNNLGLIAARAGRLQEAVGHFEAAVAAEPAFPEAHNNLGNAYRQRGDLERAGEEIARALALAPDYEAARLNLALVAWTRATHPDAEVRDAEAAVRWAERAAEGGGRADPRILDVLAAAYAEAGRFEEAVDTGTEAVRAARAAGPEAAPLARAIAARLEGYREGRPHRSG